MSYKLFLLVVWLVNGEPKYEILERDIATLEVCQEVTLRFAEEIKGDGAVLLDAECILEQEV